MLIVKDDTSFSALTQSLQNGAVLENMRKAPSGVWKADLNFSDGKGCPVLIFSRYFDQISKPNEEIIQKKETPVHNSFIFGKDQTQGVVAVEVKDDEMVLFIESKDGIKVERRPHEYWLLSNKNHENKFTRLEGDLFYKYIKTYKNKEAFEAAKIYGRQFKVFSVFDPVEAALIRTGVTFFKGMKVKDVSVLSFDIESTTLVHNKDSKVLLISNTYRKGDTIIRKLFSYDDYETDADFFDAWCSWVQKVDPSIIVGHNIYGYDLPYLNYCASKAGTELKLGRFNKPIVFDQRESKFRKDGSQSYTYNKVFIYGRNVIDTMFLSIRYDTAVKKYVSYGLKQIISQEGLEVANRQFYDASKIRENYKDPEEWEKIKAYCVHDSDDSLALFDLMIPSYFYLTQSIPKSLEAINCSATGSQINSFLLRSYLQDGHSIPIKSPPTDVEGGISFGIPGKYKHVLKVDLKSAYPSQILRFKIYDPRKDPKAHFYKMVKYFAEQRFEYKKLAKTTGDRAYKDLDGMAKIFINSSYGVLGADGLNFNNFHLAAKITEETRKVIRQAIEWSTSKSIDHWWQKEEPETEQNDV